MPRKDKFHNALKNSLIKDGWTITHDPFTMRRGRYKIFIDIGAETRLAAEREGRKIAVEIKSLIGGKETAEFERSLGQYILYRSLLKRKEPDRVLYLAVSKTAYDDYFFPAEGRDLLADNAIKLVVFLQNEETIKQWIE